MIRTMRESLDHWRHYAAYVYLVICIFDFMIMPSVFEINRITPNGVIDLTMKYENGDRSKVFEILMRERSWAPLTLVGGGLFHLAFGAILGVAAWGRGKEKLNMLTNNNDSSEEGKV